MIRFKPLSVLLCAALLLLTSCGGGPTYTTAEKPPSGLEQSGPPTPGEAIPAAPTQALRPVKVGILLPLTGQHQQLGQSMLKAAQMALFDVGYEGFELIPRDTKNSPQDAADAARSAIDGGAELLLGPIFSEAVAAVKPVAKSANVNVIAFSTDWKQAGGGAFIMGFMPFDQIQRVAQYAASQNVGTVGIIAPTSDYGQIALSAFQSSANRYGMQTTGIERFSAQAQEMNAALRKFTRFDERHPPGQPVQQGAPSPYDAVFMPVGGDSAKIVGNMLTQYDMAPNRVRRLGTGLFDDQSLTQEAGLEGAWFAAPSPGARATFERRFLQSYGYSAPRLTTLAYDATALAAVLAQRGLSNGDAPAYDADSLMNPNGFAGIDGIFRFRDDGTAERGLAVLEIRRGNMKVIDEAPKTFQPGT
jgi:branched-chain amino acid transport system substrate-binding protein